MTRMEEGDDDLGERWRGKEEKQASTCEKIERGKQYARLKLSKQHSGIGSNVGGGVPGQGKAGLAWHT